MRERSGEASPAINFHEQLSQVDEGEQASESSPGALHSGWQIKALQRVEADLAPLNASGCVVGQRPGRLQDVGMEVFQGGGDVGVTLSRTASLREPRRAPLRPGLGGVEPGVPGRVAAAAGHGQLARSQRRSHFGEQAELPGTAVHPACHHNRGSKARGDEAHGRRLRDPPSSLVSHGPEGLDPLQQVGLRLGALEVQRGQNLGHERAHIGKAVLQQGKEGLGLGSVELVGSLDCHSELLRRHPGEHLPSHRVLGNGGIEQHLGHQTEQTDSLAGRIDLLRLGHHEIVASLAQDPPDHGVEHLDDGVSDLLSSNSEEGAEEGVALGWRVATERLGVEAAHHPRPLTSSVSRDLTPVDAPPRGDRTDGGELAALGTDRGPGWRTGWDADGSEGAFAVLAGLAKGIKGCPLGFGQLV